MKSVEELRGTRLSLKELKEKGLKPGRYISAVNRIFNMDGIEYVFSTSGEDIYWLPRLGTAYEAPRGGTINA